MKTFNKVTAGVVLGALAFTSTALGYDQFNNNQNVSGVVDSQAFGYLAADITASDTSITLESGSTLANGLALIGDELVTVSGVTGTTATISRAATHPHADSVATTAAPHAKGDAVRNITQNLQLTVTATNALTADDQLVVAAPNENPLSFGAMGTLTVSGGTVVKNEDARTFTVTGLTGVGPFTLDITGTEMPEKQGQYALPVEIRSTTDTLIELGAALVSWGNEVRVRAIVQPALILNLDKTNIDISANPSVNDGENYEQKSVLSVSTNALNGYQLLAKLEGKQNSAEAQLDSAGVSEVITSDDAMSVENAFSYVAYNGDGSVTEQTGTDAAARTQMDNEVTRSRSEIKSDASAGTAFANTDTTLLPVNATGSGVNPGDGSSELAFDTFTNLAKHTVYYLLNVDYLLPSGEYEGVVTYTAVPSF